MHETAAPQPEPLAFNVVRQHVVVPDRYYRAELRRGVFHFARTGTQFDLARTSALARNEAKSGSPSASTALDRWRAEATRGKLLALGVVVILVSSVLIGITLAAGWVVGYLYLGFIFGFILIMAGFVAPTKKQAASKSRDFTLPLSRIQSATLHLPKEAGKVARLELQPLSDKLIRLTIHSPTDLETIQESFLPVLGRKAKIA